MGKPRSGPSCEAMRRSRLNFKYALRQCKQQEETARADALAKDLSNKNASSFWKGISNKTIKNVPLPNKVNGSCGQNDIVSMWENHYTKLR